MIELSKLPKTQIHRKKRLGQGEGSGKGKTGGRGTKGQKSRGKISITFSSGALSMIKRLPFIRGKFRNKPRRGKQMIINLKQLNIIPENTLVNEDILIKYKLLTQSEIKEYGIKILGDGQLNIPLQVALKCSKGAVKKIEKAGGSIISEDEKISKKTIKKKKTIPKGNSK